MDRKDIDSILKKLRIKEEDIVQMSETWSFDRPIIDGKRETVRRGFKQYYVRMKDGKEFELKMNALTKDLKAKGELGYDLIVE